MKRRSVLLLTAALLLVGCEDAEQPQTAESTSAVVQTATTVTTSAVTTTSPQAEPAETANRPVTGGVSLTNEHKVLRDFFAGADEYCDFEELGLKLTVSTDFFNRAIEMVQADGSFDPDCDKLGFGGIFGMDDGVCYFGVSAFYIDEELAKIDGMVGTNGPVGDYVYYYFRYNCDTDELARLYPPEGYDRITDVSTEIMVVRDDAGYAVVHRKSGKIKQLPENAANIVVVRDMLFYNTYDEETALWSTYWITATDGGFTPKSEVWERDYHNRTILRGVYTALCYENGFYIAINGKEYLAVDPLERVEDYVAETYYACSVMREKNALGYRARYSITDRKNTEYVLGYTQTNGIPYTQLHATKDGVIYLWTAQEMLVLSAEDGDFSKIKAAFLPREIFQDSWYNVYCDNDRLYYFSVGSLITLSRE